MEDQIVVKVKNLQKKFHLHKKRKLSFFSSIVPKNSHHENEIITALDNLSFDIQKGEMFGIIGPNGSGKTTLLRLIAGIYEPDQGSIEVKGTLAPLIQIGTGFNNELNAAENIMMAGMLYGLNKRTIKKKIPKIVKFAELERFSDMKLKHYSSGMKARLAFSTVLELEPDILLVDEVLSVGDLSFREKSFNAFQKFKKNGKTILYTTHNLSLVPKLCNRALLLYKGKIITIGDPEQVIKKYREIVSDTSPNR